MATMDNREVKDYASVLALAEYQNEQYHGIQSRQGCQVCTGKNPCLFDLFADPGEHTNLAATNPQMVAMLQAKLATYSSYVTAPMDPAVLAKDYICEKDLRLVLCGVVWSFGQAFLRLASALQASLLEV